MLTALRNDMTKSTQQIRNLIKLFFIFFLGTKLTSEIRISSIDLHFRHLFLFIVFDQVHLQVDELTQFFSVCERSDFCRSIFDSASLQISL